VRKASHRSAEILPFDTNDDSFLRGAEDGNKIERTRASRALLAVTDTHVDTVNETSALPMPLGIGCSRIDCSSSRFRDGTWFLAEKVRRFAN
jgi:hypothetical protein